MPKRPASSNLADGLAVESQNDGNKAIELGAKKKKRKGESTAKVVTASGRKLDLKKSKKIQERLQKKAEKLSKNRRRELKQLEERKKQKLTRAELIAGLQEFQLDQLTSASMHPTVERKAKKTSENSTPNFPKKLRAVSGKTKETERPKLQDELQHYETGSSCTESEEESEEVNRSEKIGVSRLEAVEKQRSQLPIYAEEQSIVETINDNTVTIISGETGSGKTTQLPQFLYEAGYTSQGHLIGVTEPRRVAAMSMSERVGYELNDTECSSYQVREYNLFPSTLPKLLSVDSRQFPVTVHFERRTPDDYMKAAFNKVCKIHDRLPEGAILVFVSGQKEVHRLVKLLSNKYPLHDKNKTEEDMIEMERDERMFLELDDLDAADCVGEDGKEESDEFELKDEGEKTSKPLYCLPLYSMMPSFLQRRVFEPAPEGQRLCVVATNVAETSLTIPNVRYVVDSGKEKRRDFDPITGVSQFNVNWCSQASANQRSGRAGRVSAGHAYRLFSSAVYEDFAKFPPPEILHKPVDQMVLHLKSMNIRKISNFPFPTPPEADQVNKAEERLEKYLHVFQDVPSITPLGRTLLVFPLAPHFSKILVLSIQNGVLPLVSTLVSALSVREPLINVAGLEGSDNAETQNLVTMLLKQRRKWNTFGQSKRLGDLNVLLCALNEAEKNQVSDRSEATKFGLRYEALKEIRKMRKQLLQNWEDSVSVKVKVLEQSSCSQIFVSCQSDQIAKRVENGELVPKGAYQTLLLDEFVFIDPTSTLYKEEPEFVLYQELVQLNDRKLMQNVSEMQRLIKGATRFVRSVSSAQFKLPQTVLPSQEFLEQLNDKQRDKLAKIVVEMEMIADQKRRIKDGEMIYGRGFMEPMAIRGPDFRRLIDCYYGYKLLSRKRLEGGVPEFRVDCQNLRLLSTVWIQKALRDLQQLYNDNWTSREPLPIRFHSYFPDNEVAEIAKRPIVTRKDILDDLPPDVTRDQVVYISTVAHQMLDREVLQRSKVFVLHAFPEHLLLHPNIKVLRQKLMKEKVKVYRLPVDAEMKWERGYKSQWASVNAAILRQMLTSDSSWQDAFRSHIPSWHFEEATQEAEQKFEYVVEPHWSAKAHAPKIVKPKEKRVHKHRYSREERNRMRKEAVG
ncbi:putative ATP-dependent RNA helicase kurz [Aphelenchoides besseyi]|nr:putative ATP-dependent RNA helicase kurz [Aphelenchoides besseyi]